MKLYGIPPTRALRPLWLINELGLECEVVPANIFTDPEQKAAFKKINPVCKLPTLVDGDLTISESVAIQLYLAEKDPEQRFIPKSLADRAAMHQWNYFLVTEIEQPLWRIALNTAIYPEAERVAADVPNAQKDCKAMLQVFEDHMTGREFVVGDRLSVADFNAAYTIDWADDAELLGDFPRLKAFVAAIYSRPKAPKRIAEAWAEMQAAGNS